MLKGKFSLIVSALVLSSVFTGCQSRLDTVDVSEVAQPTQEVTASSISTIKKEIEKTMTAQFKGMDKDNNKEVTPAEYGVATPESQQAFVKLDSNHDGKVTQKEWMPNIFEKTGMILSFKSAASKMFSVLDKSRDGYLSQEELQSNLVSPEYLAQFKKYDKEKSWFFFNKGTKTKLSKSEFENMFTQIALDANNAAPAPAPAPADDQAGA